MTARTSAQFLDGIKDEREVWLGAKRIDVSSDPAMAGSLAGMAGYFDWQHQHSEDCLAIDPVTGEKMNASLILPRSRGRWISGIARSNVLHDIRMACLDARPTM